MFEKNAIISLTITDLSRTGEGIGKVDGFVFFVKDTVPGDVIEAKVMKLKKTYGFARLIKVIEPSADRVEAPCPHARPCGGCQLQALSYARQLTWKQEMVRSAMEKIGGLEIECLQIIGSDPPFRYRNKAVIPVGYDRAGKLSAGFYAAHSHTIVPCTDCLLAPEAFGRITDVILRWMEKGEIRPYDESSGEGTIRQIFLRRSRKTGEVHLCLIAKQKRIPGIEELQAKLPEVAGASLHHHTGIGNAVFDGKTYPLWGEQFLTDTLVSHKYGIDVSYRISPMSFYQVNPGIAEKMYEKVLDLAELSGTETVLDLYCGIGTISLFLAKRAGQVIGIEVIPEAVRNAKENAEKNGIENARFLVGKAEEVVPELLQEMGTSPELIVVDPPRKGCDATLLQTIADAAPAKIIYVSCDPATLARDLKILTGYGYHARTLQPYDQFSMTCHVEAVILLSLANC